MNEKTKAAWFLDADFTPTSTLVERLRKPERVVVNKAGFTMLFSSSDKLDAADRIEKLEAALRSIIVHCEVPATPNAEALKMFARKALEGKDE
jgi:hypothetical protein